MDLEFKSLGANNMRGTYVTEYDILLGSTVVPVAEKKSTEKCDWHLMSQLPTSKMTWLKP